MSQELRSPSSVLAFCRELDVKIICLRFTDFMGRFLGVRLPFSELKEESFEYGFGLNTVDVPCWKHCHVGDVLLVPQTESCFYDPFAPIPTLNLFCGLQDPVTREDAIIDSRAVAMKAAAYMASCGFADRASIGADIEFHLLANSDRIAVQTTCPPGTGVNDAEGPLEHNAGLTNQWESSLQQRLSATHHSATMEDDEFTGNVMAEILRQLGACRIQVDSQRLRCHVRNWASIGVRADDPAKAADSISTAMYIIRSVAKMFGRSADFNPVTPTLDRPCGMPINVSFLRSGESLFAGAEYAGLSTLGLGAVGGLLKHLPSLCGVVAPSINSFHRLSDTQTSDTPLYASYSRSAPKAAVRIPTFSATQRNKRIEFGCPDASTNPYVAVSAVVMAMIDGAQNKLDAGLPLEQLVSEDEWHAIAGLVPQSLNAALGALENDHDYLTRGGVFSPEYLEAWGECRKKQSEFGL